jgi:hypothetical protein
MLDKLAQVMQEIEILKTKQIDTFPRIYTSYQSDS